MQLEFRCAALVYGSGLTWPWGGNALKWPWSKSPHTPDVFGAVLWMRAARI